MYERKNGNGKKTDKLVILEANGNKRKGIEEILNKLIILKVGINCTKLVFTIAL